MTSPTVSIIIPCYNYAGYVGEAIASVLAQTRPVDEIIAVDDGSTDGSADVMARFGEQVRLIRQTNQGQIAATNAGYAVATGDMVIFLDADDRLHPNAVERVLQAYRPDCAKVQFDLAIMNGDGEDLGRQFCYFLPTYDAAAVRRDFQAFGLYRAPVMSGNAWSRRFLQQVMPLTVASAPDGVLNALAPLYGDVITIAEPLCSYRLHGGNQDNQGAGGAGDAARFVKSITRRYGEIAVLREHAARKHYALPKGNLLDNELVFINYRLMLKKLGVNYQNSEADTVALLSQNAVRMIMLSAMPAKAKAASLLWLVALVIAPRGLAKILIQLRFNRAEFIQPIRRFIKGNT